MSADWRLPPGVSRGLWDYVRDPETARDYDARLADTPLLQTDLAFVRRWFPPSGRVADLGCGTGRLAIDLASRGYRTVAVDLSEEMLRVASAKAASAGVRIAFAKMNLVELDALADASFDGAACLFHTLGMISGSFERKQMLGHVRRLLRPGGVFVLHVHNVWFHLGTAAGRRLLLRSWFDGLRGGGAFGDFMMPPHHGLGAMPMHLFSRRELARLLRDVGFRVEEIEPIRLDPASIAGRGRSGVYGFLAAAKADT